MNKNRTLLASLLLATAAVVCHGDAITDAELKQDVWEYLTTRFCGSRGGRRIAHPRILTDYIRFDGNTNRLAAVLVEVACSNNTWAAERAMWQLGKYGTAEQLPFLYSCATNPSVGDKAVRAVVRFEGVTSNSLEVACSYLFSTNWFSFDEVERRTDVCTDLLKNVFEDSGLAEFRPMMLGIATNFMDTVELMPNVLDSELCRVYDGFQFSKRRLASLRSVRQRDMAELVDATTNNYEVWRRIYCYTAQTNYLQNAINELVAYPEASLPD